MFLSSLPSSVSAKLAALSAALQGHLIAQIDECVRIELKAFRDSYFHWLFICTIAVFVGVVLEEFDSLPVGKPRLDSAKGIFVPRYGLIKWKKRLAKLGWILIVLGVLGEGVFEYEFSSADELLQALDENLLADTQKETAFAAERAAAANERTSELQREAEQLRKDAEGERLARVELEKQIQPRTIPESDRKKLGKKLGTFAPSFKGRKVRILSQSGDAEGILCSLEIMDILARAGIEVDPAGIGSLFGVGGGFVGVTISGLPNDEAFIRSLVNGLKPHLGAGVEEIGVPGTLRFASWSG